MMLPLEAPSLRYSTGVEKQVENSDIRFQSVVKNCCQRNACRLYPETSF